MRYLLFLLLIVFQSCKQDSSKGDIQPILTGLDGTVFFTPKFTDEELDNLDRKIEEARKMYQSDPSEDNCIWVGRRLAYKMQLTEAIDQFTECLSSYPDSYKILRHRGHRYISLRQFKKAIEDLTLAASLAEGKPVETEPDGIPNKLNKPLSSVQFNIWYHLGLAYFLDGDFDSAALAYEECLKYCNNDDLYVATADWLYMTYQRLNKKQEAAKLLDKIHPAMEIIENDGYLKRLLVYKGLLDPEDLLKSTGDEDDKALQLATQGFGLGHWYLTRGDTTKAKTIFTQVKEGTSFTAFGYIAAEVELLRLN